MLTGTHYLTFSGLEIAGDARPGVMVETRSCADNAGRQRLSLATRSDVAIEAQVNAPGANWLDRQLVAKAGAVLGDVAKSR